MLTCPESVNICPEHMLSKRTVDIGAFEIGKTEAHPQRQVLQSNILSITNLVATHRVAVAVK